MWALHDCVTMTMLPVQSYLTAREALMLYLRKDLGTIMGTDIAPLPMTCSQMAQAGADHASARGDCQESPGPNRCKLGSIGVRQVQVGVN